ncbi:MAG: LysE family transporter [Rhodocyclaceae bacterium]|nr:LysE family transporter [Rhodocyclaceae bacterium]
MFDIQHYASFIAAVLIFQLIPGPGTFAILAATGRHGVSGGMAAVAGTLVGDAVWMLGAALGLAALLQLHPEIFGALQMFGAGYLCWIGLQLLRKPTAPRAATPPAQQAWSSFRRALTICLTNPKAMLFFVAFFPLFISTAASATTLAALLLHVTVISLLYQTVLVFSGHWAAQRLARMDWLRALARRLAGVALIGFGVKLAMDDTNQAN